MWVYLCSLWPWWGAFSSQPVPLCVRLYPDRDCAAERVPGGGAAGQRHLRHQNVIALLVPRGDYDSEKALLERLEACDQVDYAMGISNIEVMDGHTLTDALTPRQFPK